jgi:hypothetical protein
MAASFFAVTFSARSQSNTPREEGSSIPTRSRRLFAPAIPDEVSPRRIRRRRAAPPLPASLSRRRAVRDRDLRATPDDERMWTLQSTYVWLCPSTCCECAAQVHAQSDMRTSLGSPPSATGRWNISHRRIAVPSLLGHGFRHDVSTPRGCWTKR